MWYQNLIIRKVSNLPSDMVTMNTLAWGSIWLIPLMLLFAAPVNYEMNLTAISALFLFRHNSNRPSI